MGKRVTHFTTGGGYTDGGEQRVKTRCGETFGSDAQVTTDEAQVTCATCAKRRPMTEQEVERAEQIVVESSPGAVDERSVYVSYTQRRVGVRRRVDVSRVAGDQEADSSVDHAMLHLGKDIIDTSELAKIRQAQNAVYLWLYYKGYRSRIRPGFHVLPLALVEPFVGFVEKQEQQIAAEVEHLISKYDGIKERARSRLGHLYDSSDYPSPAELRRAFRLEYSFPVGLERLALISADIFKREQEKAVERAAEELESIVSALREQVAETVDKMVEMLAPTEAGKAKAFRADSVDKAREFFELVRARNIGGDAGLEELAERAKLLLSGVTAEQLKSSPDLREEVKGRFAEVRAALSGMVEFRAPRKAKAVA